MFSMPTTPSSSTLAIPAVRKPSALRLAVGREACCSEGWQLEEKLSFLGARIGVTSACADKSLLRYHSAYQLARMLTYHPPLVDADDYNLDVADLPNAWVLDKYW